ncbi:hypothetical protein ACLOJK_027768 [Asimina triloba]
MREKGGAKEQLKEILKRREEMKMATLLTKKRSGVSVRFVMMVAVVATCFVHQLHARSNIIDFLGAAQLEGGYGYRSSSGGGGHGKDCCENCVCTFSIPPQCRCTDIGVTCYAGCNLCVCTRSEPPQCRCLDINPCCPPKCPAAPTHANMPLPRPSE